MSTQPPVDLDEFRSAMRAAGIEDIVEPMLELFVTEAAKGMEQLRSAISAGDLDAVGRVAHSFKSSAGNIRASPLADLLQQLENAAAQGDRARVSRVIGSIETQYAAVVEYLAERRR
jgi:HPt (histidine-containing phosphotransfer) domain-containing protein